MSDVRPDWNELELSAYFQRASCIMSVTLIASLSLSIFTKSMLAFSENVLLISDNEEKCPGNGYSCDATKEFALVS